MASGRSITTRCAGASPSWRARRAAARSRHRCKHSGRPAPGHCRRAEQQEREPAVGLRRPEHRSTETRRARDPSRRDGHRGAVDHLDPEAGTERAERFQREHGQIEHPVERHLGAGSSRAGLGADTPIWEHDLDKGLRVLRLAIETHLVTIAPPAAAADRRARRPARRGDRRHDRVQRLALPDLGVLRPGKVAARPG